MRYEVVNPGLPQDIADLLFMEWIHHHAQARLGTTQWGSGSFAGTSRKQFTFADSVPAGFRLLPDGQGWKVEVDQSVDPELVHHVVRDARDAASRGDFGAEVIYAVSLSSPEPRLGVGGDFTTQFMRLLGNQVSISGRRRLSDRVLLDFRPYTQPGAEPRLFVPRIEIEVALFVPGPCPGPFSDQIAWGMAEMTRLICTFALGRGVDGLGHVFPLNDDGRAAEAMKERREPQILTLARDGVSLDVFGDLAGRGGAATTARIRSSLTAYDAAVRQSNTDVATILFVSALEALVVPYVAWRERRVVARFIRAADELCPETVEAIVNHHNVENALGLRLRGGPARRHREVLERIYDLRSTPVHGHWAGELSFIGAMAGPGSIRAALVSDLFIGAFLAFVQRPRSFLWGHPTVDPSPEDPS